MHLGLVDGTFVTHNLVSAQESTVPLPKFQKAPRLESPSMFPKSRAPMETDADSRVLLNIYFRVPSRGALPPGPSHGVPSEGDALFLEPSFIHQSKSPVNVPPTAAKFPLDVKGPLLRQMPISRDFLNMSSRVPSKGTLCLFSGTIHQTF
jgi:hypothetical protein